MGPVEQLRLTFFWPYFKKKKKKNRLKDTEGVTSVSNREI